MLVQTIPQLLAGELTPVEQAHEAATYTKKFEKTDAELTLDLASLPTGDEAFAILCKINAFAGMSDCFFMDKGKRVKIKGAVLKNGTLILTRVTPEGKKEMDFSTYLSSR
jgi:methionyl-tRNA formyltransferase